MQTQKGMATVWVVIITAVIFIGLAGGGYWYWNKKQTDDKNKLQFQIDDLNKQISALKGTSSSAGTASSNSTSGTSSMTYTNSTYKFTMTFNDKWSGWKAKENKNEGITNSIYFEVPTTDKNWGAADTNDAGYAAVFAVNVWTKVEWQQTLSDPMQGETKITENATYVFSWSHAQNAPDDVSAKGLFNDIPNVIVTFKLT